MCFARADKRGSRRDVRFLCMGEPHFALVKVNMSLITLAFGISIKRNSSGQQITQAETTH